MTGIQHDKDWRGQIASILDRAGRRLGRDVGCPSASRRYVGPSPEQRRATVLTSAAVDLVIDVGANAGQYALEARDVGYTGPIVSFEPVASCFERLERAAATDPSWTCRREALGSQLGRAVINVAANEGKSSSMLAQRPLDLGTLATMRYVAQEDVAVTTLDVVGPEIVGDSRNPLLKLDVQGLELEVLRGAQRFLPRVAVVECEVSLVAVYECQPLWRDVIDHLEAHGFALWALEPGYSDWSTGQVLELDAIFRTRRTIDHA
jgi:FkbM family methyltransferase